MKKLFSLIFIITVLIFTSFTAYADKSGNTGSLGTNLQWALDDNGVLTISGNGSMKGFSYTSQIPWYEYREDIKSVVICEGVTKITRISFSRCKNLKTVTIPASATEVYKMAFEVCSSLEKIYYKGTFQEWDALSKPGVNSYFDNATVYTSDDKLPFIKNNISYISIYDALSDSTPGDIITVQTSSNFSGDTIKIPENIVIDITDSKNIKDIYVDATSKDAYIKTDDIFINGENLYFDKYGKLDIDIGNTAKLTKNQTTNTKQHAFLWAIDSSELSEIGYVIFSLSGNADNTDYDNKKYRYDYSKINTPSNTKTQYGYVFNDVPNGVNIEITEVN